MRYDRAKQLRTKLAADMAQLTVQAEAADAERGDPQALPEELARREALHAKLDAACSRLETEARAEADAAAGPMTPTRAGAGPTRAARRRAATRPAKQPDRPGQRADAPVGRA